MTNLVIQTAKEFVRNLVQSTKWYRSKPQRNHLQPNDRASRFSSIYENSVWKNGDPSTPSSGAGSAISATESIRATLASKLDEFGAETLLDIGCGDFTWMQTLNLRQNYIGVDIVPSVIEQNAASFSSDRRRFINLDAVVNVLPEADTVLCREVLFHLSFKDARSLISNVLSSDRRLFIATSDGSTLFNSDIPTGDFRALNLRAAPFNFPEPFFAIQDDAVGAGRYLGFWKAETILAAKRA